jgi:hypothetical protein
MSCSLVCFVVLVYILHVGDLCFGGLERTLDITEYFLHERSIDEAQRGVMGFLFTPEWGFFESLKEQNVPD